jgi:hypothetical protein
VAVDIQTSAPPQTPGSEDALRKVAIEQLRKKRGLQAHALAPVHPHGSAMRLWRFETD